MPKYQYSTIGKFSGLLCDDEEITRKMFQRNWIFHNIHLTKDSTIKWLGNPTITGSFENIAIVFLLFNTLIILVPLLQKGRQIKWWYKVLQLTIRDKRKTLNNKKYYVLTKKSVNVINLARYYKTGTLFSREKIFIFI